MQISNETEYDHYTLFAHHVRDIEEHSGGELRGICPFHDDHNPSWSGNRHTGLWYCFGCNAKGNASQFARRVGEQKEEKSGPRKPKPQLTKSLASKWTYYDQDGTAWITITRYDCSDTDGTLDHKEYYQFDHRAQKPIKKGEHQLPDPRPLYNLPQIVSATDGIFFVEGEKSAEALASLGFLATTTIGGSQAPHKTNFAPLAGKYVFIWPDNDAAGTQYALSVGNLCLKENAKVTVLPIPEDKPKGWDAADAVREGWTRDSVMALARDVVLFDKYTEAQQAKVADERHETRDLRQTEEAPAPPRVWDCPDHLWRGPFAEVANILGKRSWEVWLGTLTALAARVHRNLFFRYHRPLYGMIYGLLVKPTGMGKGLAIDVCHDLMPTDYVIREAVQSGPALLPTWRRSSAIKRAVSPQQRRGQHYC